MQRRFMTLCVVARSIVTARARGFRFGETRTLDESSENAPAMLSGRALNLIRAVTLLAVAIGLTFGATALAGGGGSTYVVNKVDDVDDGTCDSVHCSLREAINAANASAGTDTIEFDIDDPSDTIAPYTIYPLSALPTVIDPAVIDGKSQPGYSGTPLIEISGGLAGDGVNGLTLSAADSAVLGLAINDFRASPGSYQGGIGIRITASDVRVLGNFVGTDPSGTVDRGNQGHGIVVQANGVAIGGPSAGDRNIVSGNGDSNIHPNGINLEGDDNEIVNNYIGTGVTGTESLGNGELGLQLLGNSNRIEGNVLQRNGIAILLEGSDNLVRNNTITLHPRSYGGQVNVVGGTRNRISANSIYGNAGLGIDLDPSGVTANDPDDADTGANDLQNFPVIDSATSAGGSTQVDGALDSSPNQTFRIELFASPSCDTPGGNGEGQSFLVSVDVATDGGGHAPFTAIAPVILPSTYVVTGTATSNDGSTSEFSACVGVNANAPTTTVNTTDDTDDGACTVSNCTLREAINAANAQAGLDTISFDIPSGFGFTIQPVAPLPEITDPVIIDGTTQPDFTSCTDGPFIEIDGTNVTGLERDGFVITAGGSTIRGLVINRFSYPGRAIFTDGAGGNTITCNYIGTNAAGNASAGNWVGISLNSSDNVVGGTTAGDRNVISGNQELGIRLEAGGNTVEGNYIGTNAAGNAALGWGQGPNAIGIFANGTNDNVIGGIALGAGNVISGNGGFGVYINGLRNLVQGNYVGLSADGTSAVGNLGGGVGLGESTIDNVVGGTTGGARNVISGNGGFGVFVNGAGSAALGNRIQGNYIGTDASGTFSLGNWVGGVGLMQGSAGSRNQLIGGTQAEAGNLISGNWGPGIVVTGSDSTGNAIEGNSIAANNGLGIDLGGDGTTPNDDGPANDQDAGPNGLQNFPVVASALSTVPSTAIEGTIDSTPNTAFRIELFASPSCDTPGGNGEGETYLGSVDVATDPDGQASFSTSAPTAVPVGHFVTTTATAPDGSTSEFSACVEVTEASASLTVNKVADSDDGACTTNDCTLREAINAANAQAGLDTISFDFDDPADAAAPYTIQPGSALPVITDPVVIDGTSQPDFASCALGPVVVLDGSLAGSPDGLDVTGGSSTIEGLAIVRWAGAGVVLETGGGNVVRCNYIGTGDGMAAAANDGAGVEIRDSASNTIGGTGPADRNVISGNNRGGILIFGAGAQSNEVVGNYIGPNAAGDNLLDESGLPVGNGSAGVEIDTPGNTVGGTSAGARNVISGNGWGVLISNPNGDNGGSTGSQVLGNYIGTDAAGQGALPNVLAGVEIDTSGNTIGGTVPGARNVISSYLGPGVLIGNPDGGFGDSTGNLVLGNYIGTNADGDAKLPNTCGCASPYETGVVIESSGNTIGGAAPGARNVISGNDSAGVQIGGDSTVGTGDASGNQVLGNYIGTNADGDAAIPNAQAGVDIQTSGNTIGGATAGARNVISGSGTFGVVIGGSGPAGGNQLLGNYIGINATGDAPIANGFSGVEIHTSNNTVGGTSADAGNVISGNGGSGVQIVDSDGNQLLGNSIGTNATGNAAIANEGNGVVIFSGGEAVGPRGNAIGGTANGAGNTIAFNTGSGISLDIDFGNTISSNSIFSNGGLGIDLGIDGIVAPNDVGDGDEGSNLLQNFPELTSASSTTIAGTLNSAANANYRLEFFSSPSCDTPGGNGEGKTFLGSTDATTNANGDASFSFAPANGLTLGDVVTATATDADGNTSEFSACKEVGSSNPPGTIIGHKFNDRNGNRLREGNEPWLTGWTMRAYADINGNGQLDADSDPDLDETTPVATDVTAGSLGTYTLSLLPPGDYIICEETQVGWEQSPGLNTFCQADPEVYVAGYALSLASGQTISGRDFANRQPSPPPPGTIIGHKFNDRNGNRLREGNEPWLTGWTMRAYADINGNGQLDADSDPDLDETTPVATDVTAGSLGTYTLSLLPPGDYIICEETQVGWEQSPGLNTFCQADPEVYVAGYALTSPPVRRSAGATSPTASRARPRPARSSGTSSTIETATGCVRATSPG